MDEQFDVPSHAEPDFGPKLMSALTKIADGLNARVAHLPFKAANITLSDECDEVAIAVIFPEACSTPSGETATMYYAFSRTGFVILMSHEGRQLQVIDGWNEGVAHFLGYATAGIAVLTAVVH